MGKKKRPHNRIIERGDGYVVEIPINYDPEFPEDSQDYIESEPQENAE